jgi:Transposase DDE domain
LTGGCPTGKAHLTETCEPDRPHLIVHVATTPAATGDVETVTARHADLAGAGLLPDEHLVDAGYVGVDHVLDARANHNVELVGPLPPDSGWQARDEGGFDLTRFHIDWDRKQVTCPNGHTSRNWRQTTSRHNLPIIQATFRAPDCTPCPDRARCTRSPLLTRHLTFRPAPSTRPNSGCAPSRPPLPGKNATPAAPGSRALSLRPAVAAISTRRATAGWPRPTCSTC